MKKSFTLIELLIVLVIIGILVTLAVPQYELFVIRARGTEAMQSARALSDSLCRLLGGGFKIESRYVPGFEPKPVPV